jgi:ribonucleoside-triphosphate reductase (formate)
MTENTKEMFPFPIIRKRDGRMTRFDIDKISGAVQKCFYATGIDDKNICESLAQMVIEDLVKYIGGSVPQVEDIQDMVEQVLIREGYVHQAKAFILYRAKRTGIREGKSELMDNVELILQETNKTQAPALNSPSAKMLRIATAASRTFYLTRLIPSQFAESHSRGEIHIHDLDYYGKTISSLQIPLGDVLRSGFHSGYSYIRPPKHFSTVGALTAMILQACQNDIYGGESVPVFDEYLGKYIRENIKEEVTPGEVAQTMEGLVYNLNMMYSRVGAQVPISTLNVGLDTTEEGRMVTSALLQAMENGLGRGETPLFPWIIYHVKKGVNYKEGDPNYDLYKKAIKVSSRRMNPSFAFVDAPINQGEKDVAYWGDGSRAATGLMSFSVMEGEKPDTRKWGWGTVGQVTINLPRVAFKISHKRKDFLVDSFMSELRRTFDTAGKQLLHRLDVLSALEVKELPFVMGEGVYRGTKNLDGDERLRDVLKNGILSIGFVGLAEAVYILRGRDHGEDEESLEFAVKTVEFMKELVEEMSREFEVNFVLTASSSGYAAQRFAQLDRVEFGITPLVNDKKYYTQGFSIPAHTKVNWEKKLEIEGKFHQVVEGGHFTYLLAEEMPDVETYEKVLSKMKESGVALGGIYYPLTESLEDGSILKETPEEGTRIRKIYRAAGLLLPEERVNEALRQEMDNRLRTGKDV